MRADREHRRGGTARRSEQRTGVVIHARRNPSARRKSREYGLERALAYDRWVELYGQDPELLLLGRLARQLEVRTMIDVGAERGSLAAGMLAAGIEGLYAIEAHPDNLAALHASFDGDPRVHVLGLAASDGDGRAELRVSASPDGEPIAFGHTLLDPSDTTEITWPETITVERRSLSSLVAAGELPARVGILKIDTEGHDLAVLRGACAVDADVVMVEHWRELPEGLGRCPWTAEEIAAELSPRGFEHFAFVVHRGQFITLKWDDGEIERGAMGNLVFLHERVIARLLAEVLAVSGLLAEQAVAVGRMFERAASERLELVAELVKAADERLALIHELHDSADERLALIRELRDAADERPDSIDDPHAVAEDRVEAPRDQ
jgi:FkbM family methyltransferase